MEDYLEAIRTLSENESSVKVTQLSDALNVSKPSVTAAVTRLAGEGLVHHQRYGAIELTTKGRELADDVCHRHDVLRVFLIEILGVPEETAERDACRLEHHLSPDSSVRLARFLAFVLQDASEKPQWLDEFVSSMSQRDAEADSASVLRDSRP